MDKPEPRQDAQGLDAQVQELEHLEQQTGISHTMQVARAGRTLAPAALGEHATPQEYVADDYDRRRGATRDAYFSVADVQLRKQLIVLAREIDSRHRLATDEHVGQARRASSIAALKLSRRPWGKAALPGIALMAFGYWTAQAAGGIAGAVAALLLGLGVIVNARNNARLRLAQATRTLERAQSDQAGYLLFPEVFSSTEEASGQRDADFDLESAHRNSLRQREHRI
jgi:hypothetical protein